MLQPTGTVQCLSNAICTLTDETENTSPDYRRQWWQQSLSAYRCNSVELLCGREFLSRTSARRYRSFLMPRYFTGALEEQVDRLTFKGGHMADTIIVATFDNSNAAYDAASALKKLTDEKAIDFKPKAGVMVKKDDKGNVSLLESKERPLFGTAVGTAVGALIGLIGGAPGAALGAALSANG